MDVDWTKLHPPFLGLSLPLAQRRLTQQYVARVRKIFPEDGGMEVSSASWAPVRPGPPAWRYFALP